MHVWCLDNWRKWLIEEDNHKTGLRVRYDKNLDADLKQFCKPFVNWLRWYYYFPLRVRIYILSANCIKNGEKIVYGIISIPYNYGEEPYIKIAGGDFAKWRQIWGKENAEKMILATIAHELTHYFQYVNRLELTEIGSERQATQYEDYILWDYEDYLCEGKKKYKHLWRYYRWNRFIADREKGHCTGLILKKSRGFNNLVFGECEKFAEYLRINYYFPVRCLIYITDEMPERKNGKIIRGMWYKKNSAYKQPTIRIKCGDYQTMPSNNDSAQIIEKILFEMAYQISVYYQWINRLCLTEKGAKRQATVYAHMVLEEYTKQQRSIPRLV